jgi:hypothetical protein
VTRTSLSTRGYIEGLRSKMRAAAAEADKADRQWNELNEAFKQKHSLEQARRRQRGQLPKSEDNMREEKAVNYALSDAFGVQGWWRTQAMYYASLIQAELAADQLLREGQ